MKLKALHLLIAAAVPVATLGLTACGDGSDGAQGKVGIDGKDGSAGADGKDGEDGKGKVLTRLATAPLGAEFTGMYLNTDGTFFLNVQHPNSANDIADNTGKVFNKGTVGVIVGANFNNLGKIAELAAPITESDKEVVLSAVGQYQILSQQNDGEDMNGTVLADGKTMGDIIAADGTTKIKNSNDPDFNGVISDGGTGFFVYTNWEDRPGGMSRIHIDNLDANGYQTIEPDGMLDFSSVNGTWVNCFGTVSPWNTPLTSEELYVDNSAEWFDDTHSNFSGQQAVAQYLGYPTDGSGQWSNPYDYGYIVEIGTNNTATAASVANVEMQKHFVMGRFSHENAVVMPDQKTVFLSDDGTGVVLFKFIADTAGNLSKGTLYAAKVTQTAGVKDPSEASFAIDWIMLGQGDNNALASIIREYDGTLAEAKHISDMEINAWAEAKINTDIDADGTIATSPFNDDRVAFLESRKAAVALGATGEFRKMEGVNINYALASSWWNSGAADGNQAYMYLAMSSFDATMADDTGDIQLDGTHGKCGVVYRMALSKDTNGNIDATHMIPAIVGGPYNGDRSTNKCNINNISNPDNIAILNDGRVLIGEDTGNHENNMVWIFDDPAI
ncbi:alkaline phosphatase PhoX [Marinagarivorans algicola]|uniref:alkaline phosphatase PhoX n=1 Tax=Marinagarivorans algicola TaxID=1513270 RepID=UPI0006B5A3B2|nr:alkaline phosphatase PhoX [Marinagarivorans algicola]